VIERDGPEPVPGVSVSPRKDGRQLRIASITVVSANYVTAIAVRELGKG
jgi:hypothetical protein